MKYFSLLLFFSLLSCGKNQQSEQNEQNEQNEDQIIEEGTTEGYYAPVYETEATVSDYLTELGEITELVISNQDKGENLAKTLSEKGKITTEDGEIISLTEITKNSCPESLSNCEIIDSQQLGIASSALIIDLEQAKKQVKDQGERGTCVAFSVNAAVELLSDRAGGTHDFSEQFTYLQAKNLTNSGDSPGLVPSSTVETLVVSKASFVEETVWPYNDRDRNCQSYMMSYPEATCSATEKQGGGALGDQPDPAVESAANKTVITEAHQLYASIGRVKQALARGYPVVLSVNANIDFSIVFQRQRSQQVIKSGVVSWVFKDANCDGGICGHAILAIGYQDDERVKGGGYIIIRNSWDTTWGQSGLAYLTYEWLNNSILDAQAIVAIESN